MIKEKSGVQDRFSPESVADSVVFDDMTDSIIKSSSCKVHTEIQSRFQPKKRKSDVLGNIYHSLGYDKRAEKVLSCGNILEFLVSEDDVKLHSAMFCKDRLCPMCNWRRSLKLFHQISDIMDVLQVRKFRFLFLTLTARNCTPEDFPETLSLMLSGWTALRHDKKFKASVVGSFRTLEITINHEHSEFHPHIHAILAVDESYFHKSYISQSEWAFLWQKACKLDYIPVVDIRTVKSGKLDVSRGIEKTYKSAIKEVSHYIAKGSDYLDGDISETALYVYHLAEGLVKRHLCAFSGVFSDVRKELKHDDVEDGDLIHVDGSIRPDVAYMIVRYCWNSGIYKEM